MKMKLWVLMALACFVLAGTGKVYAQGDDPAMNWKQELDADKEKIKAEHDAMKANAEAAKSEERDLRKQIRDARQSGDTETAEQLKDQLKTTHQENVGQRKTDKKELKAAKKEMKMARKGARKGKKGKKK